MKVIENREVEDDTVSMTPPRDELKSACGWIFTEGFCADARCKSCPATSYRKPLSYDEAVAWWKKQW